MLERCGPKRSLLGDLLRELGFSVVKEVTSSTAALDHLSMIAFDLVFVEVASGNDNHFSFLRRVRTDDGYKRVPVIVVSANRHQGVIERTRDSGATGFLAKPFSRGALQLQLTRIAKDQRKFIEGTTFAGPDRRRWSDPSYSGPERRQPAIHDILID